MTNPFILRTIFFFAIILLPGCKQRARSNTLPIQSTAASSTASKTLALKQKHDLIVFIHGTLLPMPSLGCLGSSIHTFLTQGRTLNKSWYQIYLDELKKHSIFKYQTSGPDGLNPINNNSTLTAHITQAIYGDFYKELYPDTQPHCYTFGWNGRLSHKKRVEAAHELYAQLIKERDKFPYASCKIILIGHSHGGNVILNLAQAEESLHQQLTIEKAILLGTPIQSETQSYLTSSVFKKVYNFYSHGDNIQKIDIVSTKDDFSQRRFQINQDAPEYAKLIQLELEVGNLQPGHNELWLYCGRSNPIYRKKIKISPFPILAFLPEIIQKSDLLPPDQHDVLVRLEATQESYVLHLFNKLSIDNQELLLSATTIDQKYFQPYAQVIVKI